MAPPRLPLGRPSAASRLAAIATALAGAATVVSSLSPNAPARQRLLEGFEPSTAQAVAHVAGVLGGLVLLALAYGVLRGRRPAGRAAIVVLGVLAVVHLVKGLDYEEALLGIAVAVGLHHALLARRPASGVLIGSLIALVALAAVFFVTLVDLLAEGHGLGFGAAAVSAAKTVWSVPAGSGASRFGLHLAMAIAAGSLLVGLRALFAPARAGDGHEDADHARAAAIVADYGDDSIAPFALRADKAFHFAHGGALAYRALRETAVVAGDPIGPPGSAGPILASFLERAGANGWDVVLLGAADEQLDDYRGLGLRTMQVGLEAVVDPRGFTLETPAMKTVRKAVSRVKRHGWTIELVTGADLTGDVVAQLWKVERAWRRSHRRLYGFAMAGDRLWGAPEDVGDIYALARNPQGEIRAFQRYVSYRRGLSLDAMRRLDDEPNGIADSLVAAVLEHARDAGATEVSLNFSGFGHLMAADALEQRSHRVLRWLLRRMHRRFQLERLARFAGKFGPEWRARHLVYTGRTRLPLAALRVMQAEAYIKPPAPRIAPDAWLPAPAPLTGSRPVARPPAGAPLVTGRAPAPTPLVTGRLAARGR
jgi:lysyl-tRNA synthetase, class II